jgi:hypothetical protein
MGGVSKTLRKRPLLAVEMVVVFMFGSAVPQSYD